MPDPSAVAVAKRFFFAVTIGDGEAVWEELGDDARAYVVNVAVQQGMDFELGSRLRLGTAGQEERAAYLGNLVWGLQHDLDGIDLADLVYEAEEISGGPLEGGRVRVRYAVPLGLVSPGSRSGDAAPAHTIPAGSVIVVRETGRWCVERLIPRPSP